MPSLVLTRVVPGTDPVALELVDAMVAELASLYGGRTADETPTATPTELSLPGGGFVLVEVDGAPVAGGGVKRLADDTGEIKRMYVVPGARGTGHARVLLGALEELARALGYTRVRLDTGPQQPAAQHLYETAGYTSIPNYNENAYASYWGEKAL